MRIPLNCRRYKRIHTYIDAVKSGRINVCHDQHLMIDNVVLPVLARDDTFVDEEQIEKGLALQKYFPFRLTEWEVFLFALIVGVYIVEDNLRDIFFNEIDIYLGRGSGKNGFASFLCFYFLSPIHGVRNYNIDILANTEEQAKTSFNDVYEIINNAEPTYSKALLSNYHATKTIITGKRTASTLKYNTASNRGKDSKRSGCILLDEVHEYESTENVDTLTSGLGKTPFARVITITTDGNKRGAVLDRIKDKDSEILQQYDPDNRTLPFYCHIESEEEWKNEACWEKAIPSINDPQFRSLKQRVRLEVKKMKYTPEYFPTFMAKRMNYPIGNSEIEVAKWEDIKACNGVLPDLKGVPGIGTLDYAKTDDFVAVGLLFYLDRKYYYLTHTFVCKNSSDLRGIKVPISEWEREGLLTIVDDVEIAPQVVANWFAEKIAEGYVISKIAMDNFRYSLMNYAFKQIGFDAFKLKNVKLVRPSDIMKAAPVINSVFLNHNLCWGISPIMNWYTNNTKKILNNGNITYGKIEEYYRKTDGFMALVNGFVFKDELEASYVDTPFLDPIF